MISNEIHSLARRHRVPVSRAIFTNARDALRSEREIPKITTTYKAWRSRWPFRRRKTLSFGNEGDYANGAAGTTFDFHRQGENQGTGRWQPVQIRQIFEIANIAGGSDAMYNEIL